MPMLIPVVIAIAASAATAAAIGAATLVANIGTFAITGAMVAGAVGMIVSTVASVAMSAIMKPKKAAAATTPQAESEARKQTIRGGVEARQVIYGKSKVGGVIVYAASSGTKQEYLHLVVVLAGHPSDAIETVFLNDEPIDLATQVSGANVISGRFAGNLIIGAYTGTQTTGDSFLVANSPDGWGTDHILSGCTYLYMRLTFDQDKFPSGLQSVSAVVRGKNDIYDPRTGTSGYTDNWALCVLDYLRGSHGLDCDSDELDLPYFIAAANLSQEGVQLNEAATEYQPRYTINGAFKLDAAPMDIIEKLLAAGAGTLVYVQGQYRIFGGAYSSPTVSLGPSDFAGDVELETRPPRRELFNSVRGTFIDPLRAWQAGEFPPLVESSLVTEDGEQIWRDLPLDFVTEGRRAQRLARIALLTSRDSLRLKAPMRYAGLRLAVWQMVSLTLPDFGWTAKPFRVEAWSFEPATGKIMLTLREENAANYAWYWDSGAATPSVPDTTLVDPLTIPAVTGVTLTPGTVLQPDGSILPVLDISWTASAHAFVTAHEVQWSLPAEEYVGQDIRMPSTRHTVRSVQAGQNYRARVRPVAGLVRGPWSSATVATSAVDTTAPATPTSLTATGIIRGVALKWANPTAADFAKVEIQEGSSSTGPWSKIGETASDFFIRTNLTPGSSAWFRVRALDRSGNAS
ncbi:MAG: phage tail protein, partial [Roseococcus sp.]